MEKEINVQELRDKFLLNTSIPGLGKRKKTEYEKKIDSCIPGAVEVANDKFKLWWNKNQSAMKHEKEIKITQLFLSAMTEIAHSLGIRKRLPGQ